MRKFLALITLWDLFFFFFSFLLISLLLRIYLLRKNKAFQKEFKNLHKEQLGLINLGLLSCKTLHEINNYLSLAFLNFELLKKEKKPLRRKEFLTGGLKALEALKNFIKSQQRQNNNACEEVKDYFSPQKEIERALFFLKPKIKKTKLRVEKNFKTKIKIFGPKVKFYQVISNLILNSLEAYESQKRAKSKKRLYLYLENKKEGFLVTIGDKAGGVTSKNLRKIFDPFFTTKKQGSGLGLYICKEIIENDFSGKITVESQEGRGITFKILIPSQHLLAGF